jgi:hypothetical protein
MSNKNVKRRKIRSWNNLNVSKGRESFETFRNDRNMQKRVRYMNERK